MPIEQTDVVIVGAGFGGLYALHRMRGLGKSARVFESGSDVGGTWYWNRYPGARCDVESVDYSYSFDPELEQEWNWTERYAAQPEILAYLNHVADRFDLRRDITFDTRVVSAVFDDQTESWTVRTDAGETVRARYCIMATGSLSTASVPDFPGFELFRGRWYHTSRWPHEGVDFTGQRVGVIGTGSSGIQAIPLIAAQAARLTVFQRTPNYSTPARNHPLDPEYLAEIKGAYREHRLAQRNTFRGHGRPPEPGDHSVEQYSPEQQQARLAERWEDGGAGLSSTFAEVLVDLKANEIVAEFVRDRIRETVHDPATAELLSPRDYPLGTKRMCLDTDYFATYNRDNVSLVDLRATPLVAFTQTGISTSAAHHELDCVVLATGFDAISGALLAIDVRGRNGVRLADAWAGGPKAYLGVACAGFPNMFLVAGPGSPSVLSNMVLSIEQHVEWIADLLDYLTRHGNTVAEATPRAQDEWMAGVDAMANATLFPATKSWFTGANIPGKARTFPLYLDGVGNFRRICDDVAIKDYDGFELH